MKRGFTLLEVAVALAILAIGLVSIVDINTGAARLHEQSKHLTVATLLAKGKMIDLEQKLDEDGFSDFDQQIDGTFDEQGHPEIRWHAEILKPDTAKANDQLTQLITGAMGGGSPGANGSSAAGGAASGALSSFLSASSLIPSGSSLPSSLSSLLPSASGSSTDPNAAGSPTTTGLGGLMGGAATTIIQAQVTQLVTLIQQGVRECRLTVTWPDGSREDNLSIATHFVILQPSGTGVSTGLPPGQGTQSNTNGATSGTPGTSGTTSTSTLSGTSSTTSPLSGIVAPTLTGTQQIRNLGGN